MGELNDWLQQATRHLAKDSAAQVRAEIREHYCSARDSAIAGGATSEDAEREALNALGDARTANCQYRRVLLTSAEARMLRESNWEARAVCSRPWVKRLILATPLAFGAAAAALLITGHAPVARDVLIGGIAMSPLVATLLLRIDTPLRGRVFRCVKWAVMIGAVVLLLGPNALMRSWLLFSWLWPLAWIEWTRASIRRKLPVKVWPRHLYF
jgi:hypothetical protein